jgi:hypothetical protein
MRPLIVGMTSLNVVLRQLPPSMLRKAAHRVSGVACQTCSSASDAFRRQWGDHQLLERVGERAAREKLGTILGLREIEKLSSYQDRNLRLDACQTNFDLANLEIEAGASDELPLSQTTSGR